FSDRAWGQALGKSRKGGDRADPLHGRKYQIGNRNVPGRHSLAVSSLGLWCGNLLHGDGRQWFCRDRPTGSKTSILRHCSQSQLPGTRPWLSVSRVSGKSSSSFRTRSERRRKGGS